MTTDGQEFVSIEDLRREPWNDSGFTVPEAIHEVTAMLSWHEKRMLHYLALHVYAGDGAIADMGAFLGGSTLCFATALARREFSEPKIHTYDLFRMVEGQFEHRTHFPDRSADDLGTRELFDANLWGYEHLLEVHEGDVLDFPWTDGPIEILFVDIAKSYRVFDHILTSFFPALIPGRSLVVLQDYLFAKSGPWHHVVMEKLSAYFSYVADTGTNSMIFALDAAIPRAVLDSCRWNGIGHEERLDLLDRAIQRLDTEEKRGFLRDCRWLLFEGRDEYWGMGYHRL